MLTTLIAGTMPDPAKAAEEAGHEWGAYLTEQPSPYQRPTAAQAIAKLTVIMAELGFAPAGGDRRRRRAVPAVPAPVPVP
jgi:hypothetical protein